MRTDPLLKFETIFGFKLNCPSNARHGLILESKTNNSSHLCDTTLVGESPFGGRTDPLGPASSFARRRNKIMVKASAALGSLVSSALLLAPLELIIGHQERGNIIEIFLTHVFDFTTWFEADKVDSTIGGIK